MVKAPDPKEIFRALRHILKNQPRTMKLYPKLLMRKEDEPIKRLLKDHTLIQVSQVASAMLTKGLFDSRYSKYHNLEDATAAMQAEEKSSQEEADEFQFGADSPTNLILEVPNEQTSVVSTASRLNVDKALGHKRTTRPTPQNDSNEMRIKKRSLESHVDAILKEARRSTLNADLARHDITSGFNNMLEPHADNDKTSKVFEEETAPIQVAAEQAAATPASDDGTADTGVAKSGAVKDVPRTDATETMTVDLEPTKTETAKATSPDVDTTSMVHGPSERDSTKTGVKGIDIADSNLERVAYEKTGSSECSLKDLKIIEDGPRKTNIANTTLENKPEGRKREPAKARSLNAGFKDRPLEEDRSTNINPARNEITETTGKKKLTGSRKLELIRDGSSEIALVDTELSGPESPEIQTTKIEAPQNAQIEDEPVKSEPVRNTPLGPSDRREAPRIEAAKSQSTELEQHITFNLTQPLDAATTDLDAAEALIRQERKHIGRLTAAGKIREARAARSRLRHAKAIKENLRQMESTKEETRKADSTKDEPVSTRWPKEERVRFVLRGQASTEARYMREILASATEKAAQQQQLNWKGGLDLGEQNLTSNSSRPRDGPDATSISPEKQNPYLEQELEFDVTDLVTPETLSQNATVPVPILPSFYLPFRDQHHIISLLQSMLETTCFDYIQRYHPTLIAGLEREVEFAEALELPTYTGLLCTLKNGCESTSKLPRSVDEIFENIELIRHIAVHRRRIPIQKLYQLISDAEAFARLLEDQVTAEFLKNLKTRVSQTALGLKDNKKVLENRFLEVLMDLAFKRAKMDRIERRAVDAMISEDKEYRRLAGAELVKSLGPSSSQSE